MSEKFDSPRLAINRVYTRRGDAGQTSLVGGQRVAKDDIRIEAFGTTDELNSFVGVARETARELGTPVAELGSILVRVQHELFNAGSILATLMCIRNRRALRELRRSNWSGRWTG